MTFRIHAAHAYSLLMFTTLFALAGCGGDSGGTTVTPLGDPQTPYTPKFASESLVLNLKDNRDINVERVENTSRLVSAFYDEEMERLFSAVGLPDNSTIDDLRNKLSALVGETERGYDRMYSIYDSGVSFHIDSNSYLAFGLKDIFEDQSELRGDHYTHIGLVSIPNQIDCSLIISVFDKPSLTCESSDDGNQLAMSYRETNQWAEYSFKLSSDDFNFDETSVTFQPNTRKIELKQNGNSAKEGWLNNDTSVSWIN
ncbi:hypothetical protein ACOMICROBIO_LKFPLAJE_03571 [Vibrio sp. B1FIG11]|uniref:hypothetical protein n=1 Tax=Vibrio sp. B1FIG11 TaxID=2751177 RepID=UPI0015F406FE|nr:hypothetical protein [Vibrio sp. B1FIG11]CAE6938554.1 hypothetical protein ACOMICROBIO_LKFPLAJE_03571 [Vibrio sp. B1FIG11]